MKRIKKFFEYLLGIFAIIILLFTISAVVIVKFYSDDVEDFAIELVHNQLDTKITVDEIGLTVFHKFPNISIYLKNVAIWSDDQFNAGEFVNFKADTLLQANKVFLRFNLFDLIKNEYKITSLEFTDGIVNILIDSNGHGNYFFLYKDKEKKNPAIVDINKLQLKDLQVYYINKPKEVEADIALNDLLLTGNFYNKNFNLTTEGLANIASFSSHGINYINHSMVELSMELGVNNQRYTIENGQLEIGGLLARIEGSLWSNGIDGTELNLKFEGERVDLAWVADMLSRNQKTNFGVGGKGEINIQGQIKGLVSPTLSPNINALFTTKNADIKIPHLPFELKSLNLRGSYTNGTQQSVESTSIILDNFSTEIMQSEISGNLMINNLLSPDFKINIEGEINAADGNEFLKTSAIKFEKGKLMPNVTIRGRLTGLAEKKPNLEFTPTGKILAKNLSIKIKELTPPLLINSGELNLSKNIYKTETVGSLGDLSFNSELIFSNLLPYLLKRETMTVEGQFNSSQADLGVLKSYFNATGRKRETGKKLPENLIIDLYVKLGELKSKEIITKNITGRLKYQYPNLAIEPFRVEMMDGSFTGDVYFEHLNIANPMITLNVEYKDVDIRKTFSMLNNFGQDFITGEQIAGKISGDAEIHAALNDKLKVNKNTLYCESSFIIEEGELINFQPIIELSNFLKIEDLNHIRFSRLQNSILIKEGQIIIPQMDINSSAFNIVASGKHSFDNRFDYHLAIKLSELMYNRSKRSREEFKTAVDPDDNRTIFLILYDHGQGMKVDLDQQKALIKVRQDLKEEKTALKTVLNEEFGIFKNDSSVTSTKEKAEPSTDFSFEFPINDSIPNTDTIKKEERKRWWKRKEDTIKSSEFKFIIENRP